VFYPLNYGYINNTCILLYYQSLRKPICYTILTMKFIDEVEISNKKIIVRVDFNVPLNPDKTIANDERIKDSIPTLLHLLARNNQLILISHLGRPKIRDQAFSLKPIADRLQQYLPKYKIKLIDDFTNPNTPTSPSNNEILMLENIRFYEGENKNDPKFINQLASLGEIFVQDAFAVCHRDTASITGITKVLPSYAGLLIKKEITILNKIIKDPQKPVCAIIAGSKISTKVGVIERFCNIADSILLGGGLANTMLASLGHQLGKSLVESSAYDLAKKILDQAKTKNVPIILPTDSILTTTEIKPITNLGPEDKMMDIGPQTQEQFAQIIATAKTIIWNGPVGVFEDPKFRKGTDAIYEAIISNPQTISIIGGGDTISAISGKPGIEKITHISTAGGAMLEFIEKNGHLPGLDALNSQITP
jgi:phosphoglycerate kinase